MTGLVDELATASRDFMDGTAGGCDRIASMAVPYTDRPTRQGHVRRSPFGRLSSEQGGGVKVRCDSIVAERVQGRDMLVEARLDERADKSLCEVSPNMTGHAGIAHALIGNSESPKIDDPHRATDALTRFVRETQSARP